MFQQFCFNLKCTVIYFCCVFSIIFIPIQSVKTNYQFEVFVSKIGWSGTVDDIYFRLCNINDICGSFTAVVSGWPDKATTYSYTYAADIGDVHNVQIVHTGSDTLCITYIRINDIQYDHTNSNKWGGAYCVELEDSTGGGCDTITIILSQNNWSNEVTIPCEYTQNLDNTYAPTPEPSTSNNQTIPDTITNTIAGTASREPSISSKNPTIKEIIIPTVSPTREPSTISHIITSTASPTRVPSILNKNPTIFSTITNSFTSTTLSSHNPSTTTTSDFPTNNPTFEPTQVQTFKRSSNESVSNLRSMDSDNNNELDRYKIILTVIIVVAVVVIMFLIIILIYCWMGKKKMKEGMHEVNGENDEAEFESSVDMEDVHIAKNKTFTHSIGEGEFLIVNQDSDEYKSDSDSDSAEEMYDNLKENITKPKLTMGEGEYIPNSIPSIPSSIADIPDRM